MGKNKASKSKVLPFSVFLTEHFQKNKARFRKKDNPECIDEARRLWKDLDPLEQGKYTMEAKRQQAKKRENMSGKLDSFGRPITYIDDQRKAFDEMEKEMLKSTDSIVRMALEAGAFLDREFVIGHANIFFADFGDPSEVDHFPAELALAKFSLGGGLSKSCFAHHLVDSTPKFPPGMLAIARKSVETHGIDAITHVQHLSKDYRAMKADVYRVTRSVAPDGTTVHDPIFVKKDQLHAFKQSLLWLFAQVGDGDLEVPKVLYLEDLLATLRSQVNAYCDRIGRSIEPIFVIGQYVTDVLKSGKFDYENGTACKFHADLGDPSKCSLGFCRQRAFLIMENINPLVSAQLVPGRHVPAGYVAIKPEKN